MDSLQFIIVFVSLCFSFTDVLHFTSVLNPNGNSKCRCGLFLWGWPLLSPLALYLVSEEGAGCRDTDRSSPPCSCVCMCEPNRSRDSPSEALCRERGGRETWRLLESRSGPPGAQSELEPKKRVPGSGGETGETLVSGRMVPGVARARKK